MLVRASPLFTQLRLTTINNKMPTNKTKDRMPRPHMVTQVPNTQQHSLQQKMSSQMLLTSLCPTLVLLHNKKSTGTEIDICIMLTMKSLEKNKDLAEEKALALFYHTLLLRTQSTVATPERSREPLRIKGEASNRESLKVKRSWLLRITIFNQHIL